jgi:glycosyltransferase involved in cell wall biosynthesis
MKLAPIRIGYIGGQAQRINERAIDSQWTVCLSEYAETVAIPPLSFMKLFGGSIERWKRKMPGSIRSLSEQLKSLCEKHRIQALYVNLPVILPYLMMARNEGGLKLSFLSIAHSIASEFWLKHWIGVAPLLDDQDVLLVNSSSSREALLRISPVFEMSKLIPLCTRPLEDKAIRSRITLKESHTSDDRVLNLLSIGRIESVKNIHVLLRCFADIRKHLPNVHLYIAGEYTGSSPAVIDLYREQINHLITDYELLRDVTFTGPVTGEKKDQLFIQADVLVNLSTDLGETLGFNLLEAKTWGLPVVCTSWDGFQDIVGDGEEGFLTTCNWDAEAPVIDEQAAVQACIKLLKDDTLRKAFSNNTLSKVQQYDYRFIVPKIIEALEQGLTAKSSRRGVLFSEKIRSLGGIYHLPALSQLPFMEETPVSVLSLKDSNSTRWTSWVKPIIQHFVGGLQHAKL